MRGVELNLRNVLSLLRESVVDMAARQVTDSSRADAGGIIAADLGVADPSHGGTGWYVASSLLLLAAAPGAEINLPPDLRDRAAMAAGYMLRRQNPSGLTDLLGCNYDSAPDTAFTLQMLCEAVAAARQAGSSDLAGILADVERFIRRAVPGVIAGGFHTPNHRWVIAAGLASAKAILPDLDVRAGIEAYLAEGIDLDPDGFYIEHSAAVYDAVCDRAMLLLHEHWKWPDALPAVDRNLQLNLRLLNADGTIETGLSRRQDVDTRSVPLRLAPCYLQAASLLKNASFAAAADLLWRAAGPSRDREGMFWLAAVLRRFGGAGGHAAGVPDSFRVHLAHNGLVRIRRGRFSASVFRGTQRLLSANSGEARLDGLRIAQSYFGIGNFVSEEMSVDERAVTLRFAGAARRRPGYEMPLGRPVAHDRWEAALADRRIRPLPPCAGELTIREIADGLELRYRTPDAHGGVLTQIALDFAAGGVWETDDCALKPVAGQAIILRGRQGTMRYGADAIAVGPGADAHRTWHMRDATPAGGAVRVLIPLVTPVDHTLLIRGR